MPLPPTHLLIRRLTFCAVWLLGVLTPGSEASGQTSREYEIKAVLLFNLARFVEWPTNAFPSPQAPLVIGILGRDPFGPLLDEAVAGEVINGHPVLVQRYSSLAQVKDCQILFIGVTESGRARDVISALKGRPILTVSEISGFTQQLGGMTRFYVNEQNKIRLRINLQAAKSEGLSISSKLLQVAEVEKASYLWGQVHGDSQ